MRDTDRNNYSLQRNQHNLHNLLSTDVSVIKQVIAHSQVSSVHFCLLVIKYFDHLMVFKLIQWNLNNTRLSSTNPLLVLVCDAAFVCAFVVDLRVDLAKLPAAH